MSYMTRDLSPHREILRQRLLALTSEENTDDPGLMEQQIESLLDDIERGSLEPSPSLAPLQ